MASKAPLASVTMVTRPLLGQSVGLAHGGVQVDGNGPSPGPAPAAQARDSNSRLTRSNWRTWPHRKLRVPGWMAPCRNTSASSMKSPPASAEATKACLLGSLAPARLPGRRGCRRLHAGPGAGLGSPGGAAQHWPPGGGRRRRTDAVGMVRASIYRVLLVLGSALLFQNHYPRFTGAPSCRFRTLTRRPPIAVGRVPTWSPQPLRPYPPRCAPPTPARRRYRKRCRGARPQP